MCAEASRARSDVNSRADLGEAVGSLVQQDRQPISTCLGSWGSLEVGHQLGDAPKVCNGFMA